MKKSVLALLFPAVMSAQGLQITAVTPTVLCPGDSIHITVKFIPGNTTQIKLLGPSAGKNWGYDSTYIVNNWSKSFNGTDTVYTLHDATTSAMGFGTYTVSAMADINNPVYVDAFCGTVGIKEYQPSLQRAVYFDLLGNQVFPRPGEIIIEQRGTTRRKVLLLE